MAIARPIRILGLVAIGLWIFFLYLLFGPPKYPRGPGDTLENMDRDPNLDRTRPIVLCPFLSNLLICSTATGEPDGVLWRATGGYEPGAAGTARINATIISLVRNSEVDGMVQAMRDLERTWNSKFNYPWTFFNDVPFDAEFKRRTQAETKAECRYGDPDLPYLEEHN
jgi:mannosyltransferase